MSEIVDRQQVCDLLDCRVNDETATEQGNEGLQCEFAVKNAWYLNGEKGFSEKAKKADYYDQ